MNPQPAYRHTVRRGWVHPQLRRIGAGHGDGHGLPAAAIKIDPVRFVLAEASVGIMKQLQPARRSGIGRQADRDERTGPRVSRCNYQYEKGRDRDKRNEAVASGWAHPDEILEGSGSAIIAEKD